MNSHRLNQIAMAVLAALVLFFGTRTMIGIITAEHDATETAGYEVPGAAKEGGAAAPAEKEAPKSEVLALLGSADPKKGEAAAGICKGCHTLDKGGANMVGPNLWGVVNRPIGSHEGYDYSPAVKDHGGEWTYENLDHMIASPATFIPGTKMAMYPGMPEAEKRAQVIAYLRTLSDSPAPLPEGGDSAAAGGETAPAGEAPAAAPPASETPAAADAPKVEPSDATADEAAEEAKTPPEARSDEPAETSAPETEAAPEANTPAPEDPAPTEGTSTQPDEGNTTP